MPRPDERRSQVISYLYHMNHEASARDMIEKLGLSKQTVYQVIEDLTGLGYLDITINPVDRIRKYKLRDNYREWYKKGEELGIPLSFEKEGHRRIPIGEIHIGKISIDRSDLEKIELLERQFLDAVRDGKIEINEVELDKILTLTSPSDLHKILDLLQDRPFDKAEIGLDKDSNKVNVRLWL